MWSEVSESICVHTAAEATLGEAMVKSMVVPLVVVGTLG